ncbi:MAG: cysteine desulfurase family protein [Coriobacteriia bacterium]|nr:cysteine desulfurase family protein [Coriobacteriia bacterium]
MAADEQGVQAQEFHYFDYAATAPLCEEAALAMAPYLVPGVANLQVGGNANALYTAGREAFAAMEQARRTVAACVGAKRPDEVVFAAGATEADNAAMFGLGSAALAKRKQQGRPPAQPHLITTALEHEAVLQPCKRLEQHGWRVTRLNPTAEGFVTPSALQQALCEDTLVVSVQLANAEVGSIQPVAELAQAAHKAGAVFHTDATQALGKIPVDVRGLGVDAASFSAHKIGGPKGIGALYVAARTPFDAYLTGGGQEGGKRSGTQNVCGMAGFAAAAVAATENIREEQVRLARLRDRLYAGLTALPGVRATVPQAPGSGAFLPNIVHVLVAGVESETLILRLDKLGFCVSGGSACATHSLEPSHVLTALGVPGDAARGALRCSFGRYTTEAHVDALVQAVQQALQWD